MSRGRRSVAAIGGAALLAISACSSVQQPLQSDLASPSGDVQTCARWFAALDDAVDGAGVGDGEARPVAGFPYLRVNRFLASFRTEARRDPAGFAAWEQQLRDLATRTRGYEIANLPEPLIRQLGSADRTAALAETGRCADTLAALDRDNPGRQAQLLAAAEVPDDYADWKRAVGLYPLVRIPFFQFAKGWQNEAGKMFEDAARGEPAAHDIVRYQPADGAAPADTVRHLFAGLKRDALGIPQLTPADAATLFAAFAPVYEVETTGEYDRIGPLTWNGHEAPDVDTSRPTVYRRLAFTRYGEQTLVQVVYLIWFRERPSDGMLDPLSGNLDGLFFRVTLDTSGQPLVYDTIHPCGCYHMFFPTPLAVPRPPRDTHVEWAFIPRTLPLPEPSQRIVLRLTSRSHYLTDIRLEDRTGTAGVAYAMADEAALRTLPTASGSHSVYGPTGIVPGTERGERFAVWPLGIEAAGSMREWGRHATALVGRRQFDDADLIEQRFAIEGAAAPHVESKISGAQ